MSQSLGHDPLCTWRQAEEADAGDPRRWLAGGLAVCDCDKIAKVREESKAAIAAAEQRGRESAYADYLHQKEPFAVWCMEQGERNQRAVFESLIDAAFAKGVWQGQRDMLAKCIEAVEKEFSLSLEPPWVGEVIDTLQALQEKP